MANQDRVNFVWAESALTTIPPIPVSEVAYRDTTQTPEQMEVGQQYDTIYNSARHNQLLFLLTSVAKTLCENGIMPFLAGQEYSQYARCIFTDGKLYTASRAILANEQPYPTPGDDSGVWIAEETSENLVPNSRRVIAGTGLTGGGPLSSDVTLSAKLDGKTTQAAADGAITVKDVAIGGDLGDLASARSLTAKFIKGLGSVDCNTIAENMIASVYQAGTTNGPGFTSVLLSFFSSAVMGVQAAFISNSSTIVRASLRSKSANGYSPWSDFLMSGRVGDGLTVNNGIISVPEYEGATASAAGTSGLVPPAAAGQQESFLTGGGEYKPAVQQGGGKGQGNNKIYIGYSESGLKAQADTLDLGNVVTTSAGCTKAPSAATADRLRRADGVDTIWWWDGQGGQPQYVWGSNDGINMRAYNPANFSVAYASSAGSANMKVYAAWYSNAAAALPAGGTWIWIKYANYPDRNNYCNAGTAAGGTWIGDESGIGGNTSGVSICAFKIAE